MNEVKMTPSELEREEDDGGDSTVPTLFILSLLACGGVIFINSNRLFYWEGLGTHRLGPPTLIIYGLLAWGLMLLVMASIAMSLRGPSSRRMGLILLLAADLLVAVLTSGAFGPGYQARTRGFAERVRQKLTLTGEAREWLRAEFTRHPGTRLQLRECPAAVQGVFHELTVPWSHWELYFDADGTARLASGGGMDHEWGLAIGSKQNPAPTLSHDEYRNAVNDELAAYHKLGSD